MYNLQKEVHRHNDKNGIMPHWGADEAEHDSNIDIHQLTIGYKMHSV
jgi:hypothetical protein